MAANKFATLLYRNTNKITLILIYAVLEWVLIVLLLLNSIFSYLIVKFAEFFGLKPPCLWCTRLDHIFYPSTKDRNMHRDLICEAHAKEISKLGYCSNHRKLVEALDMCEDCFSSRPEFDGFSVNRAFSKEKVGDNGEVSLNCSCCGLCLKDNDDVYSSYALVKTSSWDVLEFPLKENLISEAENCDNNLIIEDWFDSGKKILDFSVADLCDDDNGMEDNNANQMVSEDIEIKEKETEESVFVSVIVNQLKEFAGDGNVEMVFEGKDESSKNENPNSNMKDKAVQVCVVENETVVDSAQHLEFFLDLSGHTLVPVELVDSVTEECNSKDSIMVEADNDLKIKDGGTEMEKKEESVVEKGSRVEEKGLLLDVDVNEEPKLHSIEMEDLKFKDGETEMEKKEESVVEKGSRVEEQGLLLDVDVNEEPKLHSIEMEEDLKIKDGETEMERKEESVVEKGSRVEEQGLLLDVDVNEEPKLHSIEMEEDLKIKDGETEMEKKEESVVEKGSRVEEKGLLLDVDVNEEPKLHSIEMEEDKSSLVFHPKSNHLAEGFEQFMDFHSAVQFSPPYDVGELTENIGKEHSDVHQVCEVTAQNGNNESEADVSIGADIPDLDITDDLQNQEYAHSYECTHQDPLGSSPKTYEDSNSGPLEIEEQMMELQPVSVYDRDHMTNNCRLNDSEEDKVLDTPTSVDSLNDLPKKLMFLDKRDSWTEESMDGSVTGELEAGDGVLTIEHLKSALRSERKALRALYAELEEERNASEVAASQTMAMINRLQEEKAAMQMEALQYQRMMDEQSEYDQEALQIMNELMTKRDKEKQELEKELEVYRKKLSEYETREKMRILRKSKDGNVGSGFSSASCSNGEESDGLSIDQNQEAKEEEGFYLDQENSNHKTPIDVVVNLEGSLDDFEEERLSILEQLKFLEEKLVSLDNDGGQHFENNFRVMEYSHQGNGIHEIIHLNGETNGHINGFSNGKHREFTRIVGQKGKSLLPLFDAISDGNEDINNENGIGSGGVNGSYRSTFETESKKLALEEEFDHLYGRLQSLEADREFLKHCISSLNKGEKGMDLLQEILQHLRDLRNVELRVRSSSDSAIN